MTRDELQAHVISGKPIDNSRYPPHLQGGPFLIVRNPAPVIVCADGFSVSVQASVTHYCEPRSNEGPYAYFELGFPSQPDDLIMEYAESPEDPTGTVYPMVPLQVVLNLINDHGGQVSQPTQE